MRIRQPGYLLVSVAILLMTACSLSAMRDTKLEAKVKALLSADQVIAMANFGQIVVNSKADKPFELNDAARLDLSRKVAALALESHPDASAILIGFNRTKSGGEVEMVSYAWEHKDGKLSLIKQ